MDPQQQVYTVTDAAALAGIAPGTAKAYETDGLIKPARDSRGARLYTLADIETLKAISEMRASRHPGYRKPRLVIATSTTTMG